MRPNIRVEIQNNLVEAMDVDENEEGEISDGEDKKSPAEEIEAVESKTSSVSMSDLDIIGKQDQEKLQERARRFHLNPEEIKNFTDEDLKILHNSLGINASNLSNLRFEVIHMRGIEQMNAGDILDYFLEYAPVSVEWIDEESCNVVWPDKLSPARALHFMSKPVRGMPVRDDSSYFDNLNEEIDQSVLVLNKNREIQLQEETDIATNKLYDEKNSVDISEITATIPPGYWRLGNKHPNSKCILLRYSLKTDKKHFKLEQFSRYYRTQGVKNKKLNMPSVENQPSQGIFGRNKDLHGPRKTDNPWTTLAKNWDEDAQFRERERTFEPEEPKVEIKNQSLRVRLGSKRKEAEMETEEVEKPKKVKIPRMRMYADEEEEKIKRKKMLKRIDHQIKKIEDDKSNSSDLRAVLNMASRTNRIKSEPSEPEVFDLGSTLKNRNRRMVFEIKREEDRYEERTSEEKLYSDRIRNRQTIRERERERREKYSHSDEEDLSFRSDHKGDKPQSKVAVVIKTQKRPAVASAVAPTVWSRVSNKSNNSESNSESEVSTSDDSSESEGEVTEDVAQDKLANRPGFGAHEKASRQTNYKSPLKIEINNDHFKRN